MGRLSQFVLKTKRAESPFYVALNRMAKLLLHASLPVPRFARPLLRVLYGLHWFLFEAARRTLTFFYREPLFRGRCASVGKRLQLTRLPYISGHTEIRLGDDVCLLGMLDVMSGRFLDRPQLIIQDRVVLGHQTLISVNRSVVIESDVMIADGCRISDNDGHPRDALQRAAKAPLQERDIRPVRIGRYAWIGRNCHIMKGVTIGEGAIIAANSVVISDIPPYCLAMGNPAEVYFRNVGRSKQASEPVV